MTVLLIKFSDKAIIKAATDLAVTELKDSRYPLRLRINKAHTGASWHLVTYQNSKAKWLKVAEWPLVSAKTMISNLPFLAIQHRTGVETALDNWQTCAGLLSWYRDRALSDRGLSLKRKANIKTAVNKHLLPVFGLIELTQLTHSVIDEFFVWPSQQRYQLGTVRQHFAVLKKAFKTAHKLKKIAINPLGGFSFTDFVDHKISAKEARLFAQDLPTLLMDIENAKPFVSVFIFLMLAYGLRIGETRLLKWDYLDFNNQRLIVPAEITKTNTLLKLPLSNLIIEVLTWHKFNQGLWGYRGGFLFPSANKAKPLNEVQANEYVNQVGKGNWTAHDLRKLARDMWLDLSVDYIVGEQLINHALSGLNQAYIHTHMEEQKRRAIEIWHDHIVSVCNPFEAKTIARSIDNVSHRKPALAKA